MMSIAVGWSQCVQRNEAILRRWRLLLQNNLPIQRRHAGVVRGIVLLLGITGANLFFACVLGNTELVEIVLLLVGHDLIFQNQRMALVFEINFFSTGEDLVTAVLLVPLGERRRHVHLLDDVSPAHARVVGTERNLAFLRGVRD